MFASISTEAKVGLFILVALILLAYMSFQVGEKRIGFKKGYLVTSHFDNASGLERDASVRIAGVEVGRVEDISLIDSKAQVTMRIIPSVKLRENSKILIKAYGILGDKYIEIIPGTEGAPYLKDGDEITRVEKQTDIDKLMRDLGTIADDVMAVTASLRNVLGGEEGTANLSAILENTRKLTANLNEVVERNQEKIALVLDNTRDLTANLNKIVTENDRNIASLVTNLNKASGEMERTFAALSDISERLNRGEGTLGQLMENEEVFDNLNETLAALREITDKVNQGEGTIGRLINEEETVDNLNAGLKSIDKSMAGINNYISQADRFRMFLGYRGEYLFDTSNAKSYVDLTIRPNEDKFYRLGVAADPRGRRTLTERWIDGTYSKVEEWERDKLLFTAEMGKRFKDLTIRGGLLESTGGVGIDYFALNDDLKLTFEAFDFDPDRNPHLKIYADYRLLKHIYLTAGWDDFISDEDNDSPFAGMMIQFEDEDLKYLISSVPIPK